MSKLKQAKIFILLFGCALFLATGCRSNASLQKNSAQLQSGSDNKAVNSFNACALLTSDDIKEVQGETVTDAKASANQGKGIVVSQCFYQTPTFSNSVSLQITQKDSTDAAARDPKDLWKEQFSQTMEKAGESEEEREKEEDRKTKKEESAGESDEKNEAPKLRKIEDIGDEAYLVGNNITGALYVLKGNAYLRISLGGAAKTDEKLANLKTLAERALKRF